MIGQLEVPPERARWRCDPAALPFETTEQVEPLVGTVGQERAVSALEFGVAIDRGGFNIFVAGRPGSGRATTAREYLEQAALTQPVPNDWVYVHNFVDPYRPRAISLPPGEGNRLSRRIDELVEAARREIPRAFESEDYERRRNEMISQLQERQQALYGRVQEEARGMGFAITVTPAGIVTMPLIEGRPISPQEYEQLPEEVREELERRSEMLREHLEQALHEGRKLEKETAERLRQLEREVALFAVGHLFDELRDIYKDYPDVLEFLRQLQEDIPEHLEDFRGTRHETTLPAIAELQGMLREDHLARYKVNAFVDHSQTKGAPVVVEPNPTYYNLMGRLDYQARFGAMVTDFRQLKPGAIHRANGGYLLLDALDVLTTPLAWDALKRALETGEARIENIGEQFSPIPAATLRPEPIPLRCKVVLIGSPLIYYLLYHLDEDFQRLFKIKSDFALDMDRSDEHVQRYARFISGQVRQQSLRHFHKGAVARIVEYGARLVEHQSKLTTRLAEIADLVVEASFWAGKNGNGVVMAEDVDRAIAHKEYRSNLIEEKVQELIEEGTIMIDTGGERLAQVNGVSIIDLGDYLFGKPSRITARTSLGSAGVVNIEREIKLSGPIHSKGVLILAGYLSGKYAQDYPLALSATLTFEQTYDEVEGDSASSAELYALLSALSGLSIRQGIAVTGSVNQHGEIQAVGGVTRKTEGFYEVCKAKGLTGEQGVILPEANVKHLMLKDEVVEAIREGRFHLWAIRTVDQGIELLTGVAAGEQRPDGSYPEGTVHQRVDARLREYAQRLKEFGARPPEKQAAREELVSRGSARHRKPRKNRLVR